MRRRISNFIDLRELYATQMVEHYYVESKVGEACPVVDCPGCRADEEIQEFQRARGQRP